jgi:hypothetical protein
MSLFRKPTSYNMALADFDARVDELIALHIPGARLEFFGSVRIGSDVLAHAMIEASNAAAAGRTRTNPVGRPSFRDEVWPLVDRLATLTVSNGKEGLRLAAVQKDTYVTVTLAFLVAADVYHRDGTPRDVLDGAELRLFVACLYALALELERRDGELVRWIIRFDVATHERRDSEARPREDGVIKGMRCPVVPALSKGEDERTDSGLAAIAGIHKTLMIDEPWTTWHARGFTWYPYRLRQTVAATPLFESREVQVSLVEGCTPVVENVQSPAEQVDRFLADLNLYAVGSAYVFWPEERRIVSVLAQLVHEQTAEDRIRQLSSYLILQACEAERVAGWLAEQSGGNVAFSPHPEYGARAQPDEMMTVVEQVYGPRGEGTSQFADAAEFDAVVQMVGKTPFASLGSDGNGVCIEVAFGDGSTSLIEFSTAQRHPVLGSGLAVRTSLPLAIDREQTEALAAHLGRLQLGTVEGGAYLGAWCVREQADRIFVSWMRFVPNANFRRGYVRDLAMGEINRALWADRLFHPELPPRNAWPTVLGRMQVDE